MSNLNSDDMICDCRAFKFLRRSVDGKHVHDAFSERKLTHLCGMVWTRPDKTLHNTNVRPDVTQYNVRSDVTQYNVRPDVT